MLFFGRPSASVFVLGSVGGRSWSLADKDDLTVFCCGSLAWSLGLILLQSARPKLPLFLSLKNLQFDNSSPSLLPLACAQRLRWCGCSSRRPCWCRCTSWVQRLGRCRLVSPGRRSRTNVGLSSGPRLRATGISFASKAVPFVFGNNRPVG